MKEQEKVDSAQRFSCNEIHEHIISLLITQDLSKADKSTLRIRAKFI